MSVFDKLPEPNFEVVKVSNLTTRPAIKRFDWSDVIRREDTSVAGSSLAQDPSPKLAPHTLYGEVVTSSVSTGVTSEPSHWSDVLPAINATLNGITTILLIVGFILIKRNKWRAHGIVMLSATITSALFLAGYLLHKVFHHDFRVRDRFPNLPDAWANFYLYVILFPHLILAVVMLPFIGLGLWHAYHKNWTKHRRINRFTLPIWLYVSVTGVLIYYLLYHLFPQLNGQ